ncbi:hypothetical protein ZIOFF_042739 [Zingiber officinale]|uniref:Uncharacterized protein n=1 Tax=Zingiber officinale TaxID=94328 RepID=A0A8J5KVR0_ZINOF|nr:hypothetical protein ZIOFF_042739 [Zingiber officinale]
MASLHLCFCIPDNCSTLSFSSFSGLLQQLEQWNLAIVILVLSIFNANEATGSDGGGCCNCKHNMAPRRHSVTITEFGAVGDGRTLSTDSSQWPIVVPLPSYGQGQDLPGQRHRGLINGYNLTDVVITGKNGIERTIAQCSNVEILHITIHALVESPFTNGIVQDSCSNLCMEGCSIEVGHDAIDLKSDRDNYSITFGTPY